MAGAFAGALGAAIQGGIASRQQQQALNAKLKLDALNAAILRQQSGDIPRKTAAEQLKQMSDLYGPQMFDNAQAVALAQKAGTPFKTIDPAAMTNARVGAIESGNGQSIPSNEELADRLGVAPDTGVVLPPSALLQQAAQNFQMKFYQNPMSALGFAQPGQPSHASDQPVQPPSSGSTGAQAPTSDAVNPAPTSTAPSYDMQDVGRRYMLTLMGKDPTKILGPVQQTPQQIAQQTNAKVAANPLSSASQNMVDGILEWGPHLRQAVDDLKSQGAYDANNPNVGNGALDYAKELGRRGEYAAGFTPGKPWNSIIQNVEMSKANLLGLLLHGIRNPEIIKSLTEHMASGWTSPGAMGDRATMMLKAFPDIVQNAYAAEHKTVPPDVWRRVQQLTAGLDDQTPQASGAVKPGDTVPFALVAQRAQAVGMDPNQMAAQLMQRGVKVTK